MSEILITGSQSYIGSRLSGILTSEGYGVKGIDAGFITDCLLYPPQEPKTIFKDVRDIDEGDLKGTRVLVHLAGISNDPYLRLNPETVYDPTRKYTLDVARMCKNMGIKFIFASSCSVYGKSDVVVDENSPVNPLTPYSVNKMQIEGDLRDITDRDFTPIIFRFATATGLSPRMRFDLAVNSFTGIAFARKKIALNSDGLAWRPYVAVDDICKAITCAVEYNPYPGDHVVLNVGSTSENYTLQQVVETVRQRLPQTEIVPFAPSSAPVQSQLLSTYIQDGKDIRDYRVSFEKILRELPGFACDYTLPQIVGAMVSKFEEIGLSEEHLNGDKFYRLKRLENLIRSGKLTSDLRWTK